MLTAWAPQCGFGFPPTGTKLQNSAATLTEVSTPGSRGAKGFAVSTLFKMGIGTFGRTALSGERHSSVLGITLNVHSES